MNSINEFPDMRIPICFTGYVIVPVDIKNRKEVDAYWMLKYAG